MPEAELSLIFLRPLNQLGVRYIVSGSVASILYGEPRFTNGLDLVVFLRQDDIRRLVEAFPAPEAMSRRKPSSPPRSRDRKRDSST